MKYKKILKDSIGLGKIGITTGVMASAVTGAGGDASGLNAFSQIQPTFATLTGAKHTISMTNSLLPGKKRSKRKR